MSKKMFAGRYWLVLGMCIAYVFPVSSAFARSYSSIGRTQYEIITIGHKKYHYRDGRFYKPGLFGFTVVAAPFGITVKVLPPGHKTLVIGGIPYYYYNNIYYKACPSGYVVVSNPLINAKGVYYTFAARPQGLLAETITVNIPNSDGSYSCVTLAKSNNGYIGPQGEYYHGNPTVEQLRALYGK